MKVSDTRVALCFRLALPSLNPSAEEKLRKALRARHRLKKHSFIPIRAYCDGQDTIHSPSSGYKRRAKGVFLAINPTLAL
jgi:tRNA A37 threonylcarbamoyladenosine synthetase subunit TsaC/SUA5/YrdC